MAASWYSTFVSTGDSGGLCSHWRIIARLASISRRIRAVTTGRSSCSSRAFRNAIRSSTRPPYFPAKEATLKRALTPATNPAGLGSSAAAIYAAVVMILNATHHHAVIDPQVILAALGAAAFLYARFKVTPVADPRDGNGVPLKAPGPVITVNASGGLNAEAYRQIAAAVKAYGGGMSGLPARPGPAPPEPHAAAAT